MPRQGVPYPSREICSLKCQIDALQRQINELMKSVNGVQGDGQGNLSLISGDPAIVINSDQVQNEIEIALDQSQLPAAAVSSVNSQTGAVQLEADDIPSDGNSDVQADIDALKALGVNLQGAINNEVTARGNADAALQGNINALQASLPGEAAQAVANDPTVQGLVTADAQNVKLGGSQNITGVKTVPTEATGSATQQIANGAKVKNELDNYAPMVRTTGNQTIAGVKSFSSPQEGAWNAHRFYFSATTGGNWYKIAEIANLTGTYQAECLNFVINSSYFNANKGGVALFSLIIPNASLIEGFIPASKSNLADIWGNFALKIGKRSDGNLDIFAKGRDYTSYSFLCYAASIGTRSMSPYESITPVTPAIVPEPQPGDYTQLITVTI